MRRFIFLLIIFSVFFNVFLFFPKPALADDFWRSVGNSFNSFTTYVSNGFNGVIGSVGGVINSVQPAYESGGFSGVISTIAPAAVAGYNSGSAVPSTNYAWTAGSSAGQNTGTIAGGTTYVSGIGDGFNAAMNYANSINPPSSNYPDLTVPIQLPSMPQIPVSPTSDTTTAPLPTEPQLPTGTETKSSTGGIVGWFNETFGPKTTEPTSSELTPSESTTAVPQEKNWFQKVIDKITGNEPLTQKEQDAETLLKETELKQKPILGPASPNKDKNESPFPFMEIEECATCGGTIIGHDKYKVPEGTVPCESSEISDKGEQESDFDKTKNFKLSIAQLEPKENILAEISSGLIEELKIPDVETPELIAKLSEELINRNFVHPDDASDFAELLIKENNGTLTEEGRVKLGVFIENGLPYAPILARLAIGVDPSIIAYMGWTGDSSKLDDIAMELAGVNFVDYLKIQDEKGDPAMANTVNRFFYAMGIDPKNVTYWQTKDQVMGLSGTKEHKIDLATFVEVREDVIALNFANIKNTNEFFSTFIHEVSHIEDYQRATGTSWNVSPDIFAVEIMNSKPNEENANLYLDVKKRTEDAFIPNITEDRKNYLLAPTEIKARLMEWAISPIEYGDEMKMEGLSKPSSEIFQASDIKLIEESLKNLYGNNKGINWNTPYGEYLKLK